MPRTSRTAGATRAAAAVCPQAPSLLLLPLVVGAVLVGLWLLGAAPASAEEDPADDGPGSSSVLPGDPTGTGSPVHGSLGGGPPEGGVPDGASPQDGAPAGRTPVGGSLGLRGPDGGSLGLRDSAALEGVLPGEVAEPVASTLGSVHHRLEAGAERTAAGTAAVLPETAWRVGEVGEGARRVIRELDRTGGTVESALAPVARTTAEPSAAPARNGGSDTGRRPDGHERSGDAATEHGTDRDHSPSAVFGTFPAAAPSTPSDDSAEAGSGAPAPAPPAGQLTTGSNAPGAGPAPASGVAGYLTAAPVTAPASGAVPLAAHALHPVPGGPSDDPTVSPD
ncbi:hypothetical protein A6A08_00890 [Nocardiopsis sp. TSRI0078]|uniref:hypothetical protein n=1 Tax=unclassified Nocardiopsis TaxID=2649073 RepID=UPI00093CE332|nr:hypothetical protein [Nocardiopsis sp. TSRI0078]OKI23391.1 hypothetical protein A6A08_00890 [Nocardiopsis sp. TSRI0078]